MLYFVLAIWSRKEANTFNKEELNSKELLESLQTPDENPEKDKVQPLYTSQLQESKILVEVSPAIDGNAQHTPA